MITSTQLHHEIEIYVHQVSQKLPVRGTSLDRKTPMSMADESEYNPDK